MHPTTRRARRNGFQSAAAETVSYSLSEQFSKIFGTYVDPTSFCFNIATGYWSHNHQDVQRFDGHFKVGKETYTIGSWDHTLTELARRGCHVIDNRGNRMADNEFEIDVGKAPVERDDSDGRYSLAQLEEIEWKKNNP